MKTIKTKTNRTIIIRKSFQFQKRANNDSACKLSG